MLCLLMSILESEKSTKSHIMLGNVQKSSKVTHKIVELVNHFDLKIGSRFVISLFDYQMA